MATYLFAGTGMTQLYLLNLDQAHLPGNWKGPFRDVLPILLDAQSRALASIQDRVLEDVRPDLMALIRQLTHPDPERRGDPKARAQAGRPVGMERYVSRFHALAKKAEFALRTKQL